MSADEGFWYLDSFGNGLGPWLGGYQTDASAEPDGGRRWVTSEPFSYSNRAAGQPDQAGEPNQNRIRFFGSGALTGAGWDDGEADNPAEHRRGYVCETE